MAGNKWKIFLGDVSCTDIGQKSGENAASEAKTQMEIVATHLKMEENSEMPLGENNLRIKVKVPR